MSTFNTILSEDAKVLSDAEAGRIIEKVVEFCSKEDELTVKVQSLWHGGQRWARNRAFMTSEMRSIAVEIGGSQILLNQVDDASLRAACDYLEEKKRIGYAPRFVPGNDMMVAHPTWESKGIPVWSNVTFNRKATENAQLVSDITARAESNGMMSAGSIDAYGAHFMGYKRDSWGRETREKGEATMAECSSTVRHPKGVGSGWAGASSFDLKKIDLAKLGEVAFDKCIRSIDPVRIEPGRYQTILEPQATASFAIGFFDRFNSRGRAEGMATHPFYLGFDPTTQLPNSKLGLQVADRRLNMFHDPLDPVIGSHIAPAMKRVDYLKNGILTAMGMDYRYTLAALSKTEPIPDRTTFEMSSTEITSIDDMISSMKRGLLLTRVSDMTELDDTSALYTGLTRDGLWLIENGKITKAVRNFRWIESPFFVFNNVEAIGEAVPVMSSWYQQFPFAMGDLQKVVPSVVVPTMMINDFSFSSTTDAI